VCAPTAFPKTVDGAGREGRNSQDVFVRPGSMIAPQGRIRWAGGMDDPRGRVSTTVLSLATLGVLAGVAVIVLATSLSPPENSPSPPTEPARDAVRPPVSSGPEIVGTITIATDLAGRISDAPVLFIIARKTAGPPFAVKRIAAPRFPLPYRLGPEDVMMAGSAFEGEVRISARLSRTGSAGPPQPGDLEGEHAGPVQVGARNVDVVISRVD